MKDNLFRDKLWKINICSFESLLMCFLFLVEEQNLIEFCSWVSVTFFFQFPLSPSTILGKIYHNQSSYYLRKFLVLFHLFLLFVVPMREEKSVIPFQTTIVCCCIRFCTSTAIAMRRETFLFFQQYSLARVLFFSLPTTNVQLAIRFVLYHLYIQEYREYVYTEFSGVIIYRKQTNVLPSIHSSLSLSLSFFFFSHCLERSQQERSKRYLPKKSFYLYKQITYIYHYGERVHIFLFSRISE